VIDSKPKSVPPERLRRVRNLEANPRGALLIDHYEEDWQGLWFVLLEGKTRMLRAGPEHATALEALRQKYPQYREMRLTDDSLVIALDIEKVTEWSGKGA
jgi:PPOX class probable F420-dependent enzyme